MYKNLKNKNFSFSQLINIIIIIKLVCTAITEHPCPCDKTHGNMNIVKKVYIKRFNDEEIYVPKSERSQRKTKSRTDRRTRKLVPILLVSIENPRILSFYYMLVAPCLLLFSTFSPRQNFTILFFLVFFQDQTHQIN